MPNLEMKTNLTVDPNVPQSQADAAAQQQAQANQQNELNKAATMGGSKKRNGKKHRKKTRKLKGGFFGKEPVPAYPLLPTPGYIVVNPLPLGSQTTNTASNNVQNANVYASSVNNATNDSKVGQGVSMKGGKRRKKKKSLRKKSSKKNRKNKKAKKSKKKRSRRRK